MCVCVVCVRGVCVWCVVCVCVTYNSLCRNNTNTRYTGKAEGGPLQECPFCGFLHILHAFLDFECSDKVARNRKCLFRIDLDVRCA